MRILAGIFSIAFICCILFIGCDCDKYCPAFDASYLTAIPYTQGNVVVFTNGNGSTISFNVTTKTVSESYKQDGAHGELGGCREIDCKSSAKLAATSTATRNGSNKMEVNMNITDYNNEPSTYRIFDFIGYFYLSPSFKGSAGDVFEANVQLGARQYANVLVSTIDTLQISNASKSVWKVYFSKDGGILGFHDRQTQSLFYLQ